MSKGTKLRPRIGKSFDNSTQAITALRRSRVVAGDSTHRQLAAVSNVRYHRLAHELRVSHLKDFYRVGFVRLFDHSPQLWDQLNQALAG